MTLKALPATFSENVRWNTYVDRAKANKKALRVISEGDSWFAFSTTGPALDGCVVDLAKTDSVFLDLATSGDTADEMFGTPKGLQILRTVLRRARRSKVSPHLLLISGGGNDVLANHLNEILWAQIGPDAEPENWINEAKLKVVLTEIKNDLETLLALRNAESPDSLVILHSYSNLVRMGKEGLFGAGPWVGDKMGSKGLTDVATQRGVVKILLNSFFEQVLQPLEDESTAVVDLREKLAPYKAKDAWFDEIHPTPSGYRKLAQAYLPTLRRLLPGRF